MNATTENLSAYDGSCSVAAKQITSLELHYAPHTTPLSISKCRMQWFTRCACITRAAGLNVE